MCYDGYWIISSSYMHARSPLTERSAQIHKTLKGSKISTGGDRKY